MHHQPWNTRMSVVALLGTILLVPLISACTPQSASQVCLNGKCLTYATWGGNITLAINKQAVGYTFIIEHQTLWGATGTFGEARTATDPPETPMSLGSVSDIASVTKTLTAVAVLKLLEKQNINLKDHIAKYLPTTWTLGKNVDTITFEELLTQTSGIIEPSSLPFPDTGYTSLQATMSQPVYLTIPPNLNPPPKWSKQTCQQDYQQRLQQQSHSVLCYQNANFALFRILIPYILGFNDAGLSALAIQAATDAQYLAYMNSVYAPDIAISCTPASGTPYVLVYPYPAGTTPGVDWGDWSDLCGGGGLQLSVTDMAHFLSRLMSGAYLSQPMLTVMVDNLYGWDWEYTTITYGTCVQKNGGLVKKKGKDELSTLLVYCPATDLGFVGIANSPLGPCTTASCPWDSIVESAYQASWQ